MIRFFQCPYCEPFQGGHKKAVPKNTGKYRVKILEHRHILIFQCQKCSKSFRVRMMGKVLLWADMTPEERTAFKLKHWVKKSFKKLEGKNGRNKKV